MQVSIRKKLEDAKEERGRSQTTEDVRALRDEIAELRSAPSSMRRSLPSLSLNKIRDLLLPAINAP